MGLVHIKYQLYKGVFMKGAIIGDVVGSIYEFNNILDYNFPLLTEDSTYTDDTICTVAIADALINRKPYSQTLKEWCRKYPNPMGGYGNLFQDWINSDNPNYHTNSYGNGALMRVSSLGLIDVTPQMAMFNAKFATECSHNHKITLTYVSSYIMILRRLRLFHKKESVTETLNDSLGKLWREDLPEKGTFTETVMDTLPLAADLFLKSQSFEDSLRLAVSYGGDSDTLAAIVCGMSEAYYGVPDELWLDVKARLPKDMLSIVDQFYSSKGE